MIIFTQLIYFILLAIMSFLLLSIIIFTKYKVLVIIVSVIIALSALLFSYRIMDKHNISDKITKCFFGICLIGIVVMQFVFAYKFPVKPSADFGVIYNQAVEIVNTRGLNEIKSYFEMYPNNIPLLALITLWFKLMKFIGVENFRFSAVVLNIAFIDTAVTLFYLASKRKLKNVDTMILLMMMVVFFPFYTYVGMFYTDTMSMPFIAAIVYICACMDEQSLDYKKVLLLVLLGVVACFGFKMKATVGILLIAFIIYELISKKSFKIKIINLGVVLCSFILCSVLIGNGINKVLPIDKEGQSKYSLPYTHWIVMGLGKSGYYNEDVFGKGAPLTYSKLSAVGFYDEKDVVLTANQETHSDKIIFNLQEIEQKISEYGPKDLAKHLVKKNICIWGDGTYYSLLYLTIPNVATRKVVIFRHVSFAYHLILILLFIVGLVDVIKQKKLTRDFIVYISVLGLIIFLSIWETSPRYILNFMPLILFQSSSSIGILYKKISSYNKKLADKKF